MKTKKFHCNFYRNTQFEFAGFYMAKEKGFYQEVGLDVELKEFNFGTNIKLEFYACKDKI